MGLEYPDRADMGSDGKFTDGDAPAGIPPSLDKADDMNAVYDALIKLTNAQTSAWTGLDSMPVGSVSPLLFSSTSMSDKWTLANGVLVPITPALKSWFDEDSQGFIANWNATCQDLGLAQITLSDGFLAVPDVMSAGFFMRAGSSGSLQEAYAGYYNFMWHVHGTQPSTIPMLDDFTITGANGSFSSNDVSHEENIHVIPGDTRPVNIQMPVYFKIA